MNDTNFTVLLPPKPFSEKYWIVSEVIIITCLLAALYLSLSIAIYLWRISGKSNRKELKQLLSLNLASAILAILRLSSDQAVAFLGWKTNEYCFYFVCASFVLYSASISPAYTLLWLRQHSFYTNRKLQNIQNKRFVILSYFCLALLVIGWIIVTIVYVTPSLTGWMYLATQEGCRDAKDQQDFEIVPIFINIVGGLGQLALLSLLLYPLLKCRKPMRGTKRKTPSASEDEQQPTTSHAARHYPNGSDNELFVSESRSPLPSPKFQIRKNESGAESDAEQQTPKKATSHFQFPTTRMANPQIDRLTHKKTDSLSSVQGIIVSRKMKGKQKPDTPRTRSRSEKKREKKLMVLIKKVFILAVICVMTDVIATILQLVLVEPELIYLAIYDINLIVNITCITLSFERWKFILRFWKNPDQPTRRSRFGSNGSQISLQTLTSRLGTLDRFSPLKKSKKKTTTSTNFSPVKTNNPDAPSGQDAPTCSLSTSR